ncbi:hypothetical protein EDD18DRAFT_1097789 [Armillaria luteobubalina]|uniref:Uncharacterized protein n=1 Tax=Armillaria luteobubalina TaxID=153913 RepID=A0AA39QP15_9AGAR|nr:hypothetical protein EDD18DRAFT_1097789 [Armillaria luteobubalina]
MPKKDDNFHFISTPLGGNGFPYDKNTKAVPPSAHPWTHQPHSQMQKDEGLPNTFIENAAPPLREFLLWQQTFPINKKLILNFLPIEPNRQSWVIATYCLHFIKNIKETITDVLWCIKRTIGQGFSSHTITVCEEMMHMWHLDYIPTLQNDREVEVWQLTGGPIMGDNLQH